MNHQKEEQMFKSSGKYKSQEEARQRLTRLVSTYSVIGVASLGAIAILAPALAGNIDVENVKYVFNAVLPLLGTWMGTVLAYYYSRENFEAANRSVKNLVRNMTSAEKLKSIRVHEVWIPIRKMQYLSPINAIDEVTVGDLLDFFNKTNVTRAPILDQQSKVHYIIHKSTMESLMAKALLADGQADIAELRAKSIANLKQEHGGRIQRILTKGMGFIRQDDHLLKARRMMQKESSVRDVFVTKDGSADSAVLGWITNRIIMEKLEL